MPEENKKEKTGFLALFFRNKGFMKDVWWIQLVFLFLFLLAGGMFSWHIMKKQAQNLVGGSNYQDMSSHSRLMERNGILFKLWTFFASDEEVSKSIASRNKTAGDNQSGSGANAFSSDDADAAAQLAANDMAAQDKDAGTGKKSQGSKGLFAKAGTDTKIPKIGSSLSGPGFGSGGSKTSSFSDSNQNAVSMKNVDSFSKKGDGTQGGKTSALESLKGVYKSSLQGTRAASADTARNWIARSFDATGKPRKAIEYNEKAKKAFDRINPNSIPGYLKDEDMSLTNADSLPMPDVKPLGNSKADSKALEEQMKQEMEQKAKTDMVKSLTSSLGSVASAAGSGNMSNPYGAQTLDGSGYQGIMPGWTATDKHGNILTGDQLMNLGPDFLKNNELTWNGPQGQSVTWVYDSTGW